MAIIETKVDKFVNLIYEKKQITSKEMAKLLEVNESYVRKLAYIFQKRKMIDLKTSLVSLTITLIDH